MLLDFVAEMSENLFLTKYLLSNIKRELFLYSENPLYHHLLSNGKHFNTEF